LIHRAFWFNRDAGAYWSVINDDDYSVVELADRFLQYIRFARGRAEPTTRKYAEAIAMYHRFLHGTIAGLVATGDHCFPYV
jgi:integrase/recombinase XerD